MIGQGRNAPTAEWNSRDTVVLYNRIPKTGSTSFMGIVYDLCRSNHFNVIHVNISRNNHYMSLWDQLHFAQNISNWVQRKPAVYHGHVVYINFKRLGAKNPIYINVVRDPLERLISYYYFLRYGDDFRPYLSRRRKGNNETFDQCIRRGGKDCNVSNLWLQIPFFCGHSADCRIPGNPWALSKAKETLLNDYLLVGITEELEDFVLVLEVALPSIFAGAMETIKSGAKFSLRKTLNKVAPSGETLSLMRENNIWKMEQEFYEFAKRQFHFVKAQFLNGIPSSIGTQRKRYPVAYHYEKVKPKLE
ncbi:Sulfotransfer 2 domain containing protein [Trichuris trichiura]|uniref:Sulfotransfer 2 domain containing protein n=1 Tax=Trichuris trichiura TaxID=36087 RepID=A0A077ZCG6_TRITR|nr:Sulfotransfer 2 domain containing protein [Trichuris trichiura]